MNRFCLLYFNNATYLLYYYYHFHYCYHRRLHHTLNKVPPYNNNDVTCKFATILLSHNHNYHNHQIIPSLHAIIIICVGWHNYHYYHCHPITLSVTLGYLAALYTLFILLCLLLVVYTLRLSSPPPLSCASKHLSPILLKRKLPVTRNRQCLNCA